MSERHIAENRAGDEGPVDRRERNHMKIGRYRRDVGDGRTDGHDGDRGENERGACAATDKRDLPGSDDMNDQSLSDDRLDNS